MSVKLEDKDKDKDKERRIRTEMPLLWGTFNNLAWKLWKLS
jgi:hypothetical protein